MKDGESMNDLENLPVDQLWYTWSDVGLSNLHAGFRIRAASPNLTEIYSERVKSMDRYMRYALPPGTDRYAITPDMAPVCLAFVRTQWKNEYILVHKNYVGADGVGRLGNFFVHVFALGENSQDFSPVDAIWLWGSDIWATKETDKDQDRRNNKLETISEKTLIEQMSFRPKVAQAHKYLPFLIEAYLSRKERYPLYIAAPAHNIEMIACLIAGLVNCLPKQLLDGLTFSTYEADVSKATTEIVGTSWIAVPGKEEEAAHVFPPQFYREKLALNCYTGEKSLLKGHPQIIYKPLAADFAAYASDCLASNNIEQLYALCDLAERSQTLNVDIFLNLYNNEIANVDSIVEKDIERDLADPGLRIDRLCNIRSRKRIIDLAGENAQWGRNQLRQRLLILRNQAIEEYKTPARSLLAKRVTSSGEQEQLIRSSSPELRRRSKKNAVSAKAQKNQVTLTEALTRLAERAIPDIIDAMKKVAAEKDPTLNDVGGEKKNATIVTLLQIMDSCLLPQDPYEIWKQLLEKITGNQKTRAFLLGTRWDIFLWLLKRWNNAFPLDAAYDDAIRPLLIVPWNELGAFLQIGLRERHKQWNIIAIENLSTNTALTPQVAQELEKKYSHEINDLLVQCLQEARFTTAAHFALRLIENGYSLNPQFASLIEQLLAQLVDHTLYWSDAKTLIVTLVRSGYMGGEPYQNLVETLLGALLTNMQKDGLDLFDVLVEHKYPRKKRLVDLLLQSPVSKADLKSVLYRVYRTPEELNSFFITDGAQYLSTSDQISTMLSLHQELLQISAQGRLERLLVLLQVPLSEGTILALISGASLETNELARILKQYGKGYLKRFQQEPRLAKKVVEWFTQLVDLGYADRLGLLFVLFTSQTNYQYLDTLLGSAQLSLDASREFFRNYGFLSRYFPFFYESGATLSLFSRLAQAANTQNGNESPTQLATEKMNLLFVWLDPSGPLPKKDTVERFLDAASLTQTEQIQFLERYGEAYLTKYPQQSILTEYISTYVYAFNTDSLQRAETKGFFTFLTQNYQHLRLDTNIQARVQDWYNVDSYLTSPVVQPDQLNLLAKALYELGLPNNAEFSRNLARAFARCVRTSDGLQVIMTQMRNVPNINNSFAQLLYILAEQVAEIHRQQQNETILIPYLSFALSMDQEGNKLFIKEFSDTLLYNIDVLDLQKWVTLNTIVTQQGLSPAAWIEWNDYLGGLALLEILTSDSAQTPSQIPSTVTDVPKAPSWRACFRQMLTSFLSNREKQKGVTGPGREHNNFGFVQPGRSRTTSAKEVQTPSRIQSEGSPQVWQDDEQRPWKQQRALRLGPTTSHTPQRQQSTGSGINFSLEQDPNNKKKRKKK